MGLPLVPRPRGPRNPHEDRARVRDRCDAHRGLPVRPRAVDGRDRDAPPRSSIFRGVRRRAYRGRRSGGTGAGADRSRYLTEGRALPLSSPLLGVPADAVVLLAVLALIQRTRLRLGHARRHGMTTGELVGLPIDVAVRLVPGQHAERAGALLEDLLEVRAAASSRSRWRRLALRLWPATRRRRWFCSHRPPSVELLTGRASTGCATRVP